MIVPNAPMRVRTTIGDPELVEPDTPWTEWSLVFAVESIPEDDDGHSGIDGGIQGWLFHTVYGTVDGYREHVRVEMYVAGAWLPV